MTVITQELVFARVLGAIRDTELCELIDDARETDPLVQLWFDLASADGPPPLPDEWKRRGGDLHTLLANDGFLVGGADPERPLAEFLAAAFARMGGAVPTDAVLSRPARRRLFDRLREEARSAGLLPDVAAERELCLLFAKRVGAEQRRYGEAVTRVDAQADLQTKMDAEAMIALLAAEDAMLESYARDPEFVQYSHWYLAYEKAGLGVDEIAHWWERSAEEVSDGLATAAAEV